MEKIVGKLSSWNTRVLSQGGRLTLIKSVLCSMSVYLLHVLEPPSGIIRRIEQVFANFLWGTSDISRKVHWSAWEKLCLPIEEGGLGIKNMESTVEAFSMKLWYKFREQNSLWAAVLERKYWKEKDLISLQVKRTDSYVWKRMNKIKEKMKGEHILEYWRRESFFLERPVAKGGYYNGINEGFFGIRNGCDQVWVDHLIEVEELWLQDVIIGEVWNLEELKKVVPQEIINKILTVKIEMKAIPIWKMTSNGAFSVKSAYEMVRSKKRVNKINLVILEP